MFVLDILFNTLNKTIFRSEYKKLQENIKFQERMEMERYNEFKKSVDISSVVDDSKSKSTKDEIK